MLARSALFPIPGVGRKRVFNVWLAYLGMNESACLDAARKRGQRAAS